MVKRNYKKNDGKIIFKKLLNIMLEHIRYTILMLIESERA